ncbi:MAG: HPP family protein [Gammaproteobacteria bacterium]|nr:HPP family protein [Gammaproteobacteria bacterium]MDH5593415.1 HPP family protein [Gammaproteobacteria bacterium]
MKFLLNYFSKMRGGKHRPHPAPYHEVFWSTIGAFIGIYLVYYIGHLHELRLEDSLFLIGSFGASAILIYGVPNSPYAQPPNLIGGHIVSAIVGVACVWVLGDQPALAASLAVALALAAMHLTNTIHPPGGATALIAVVGGDQIHALGFWYVLSPVGLGAFIMLIVALLINNLSPHRRYPQFWF